MIILYLTILQLSSIADLNGVQATTQYEPPANVAAAGGASTAASGTTGSGSAAPAAPSSSSGPPPPASTQDGPIPAPEAAGSEPIPPPQPGMWHMYAYTVKPVHTVNLCNQVTPLLQPTTWDSTVHRYCTV